MPWPCSAASRSASFWARCARTFCACRAARASKPAREACALVSKSGFVDGSGACTFQLGQQCTARSDAIAAIEPGRGPRPNRCRAKAASRVHRQSSASPNKPSGADLRPRQRRCRPMLRSVAYPWTGLATPARQSWRRQPAPRTGSHAQACARGTSARALLPLLASGTV